MNFFFLVKAMGLESREMEFQKASEYDNVRPRENKRSKRFMDREN